MKKRDLLHWDTHFAETMAIWLPKYNLKVETKVKLGKMLLESDLIVIKKTDAEPLWEKHPVWKHFTDYNIIEFKSVSDKFEQYDLGKLIIYGFAYQERKKLAIDADISLWLILPEITPLLKKILNKHGEKLIKIGERLYKGKVFFPLFILEYKDLPVNTDYYGLNIFTKKIDRTTANQIIESNIDKTLLDEYIKVLGIFHLETLKEVMNMLTLKQVKKGQRELLEIIIKKIGKEGIIDIVGENELINELGKEKVIRALGKEEVIKTLGKEEVIKYLESQGMKVIEK